RPRASTGCASAPRRAHPGCSAKGRNSSWSGRSRGSTCRRWRHRPALLARAMQAGLDQIERGGALRARLQERIAQLRDGLAPVLHGTHWQLGASRTAIQPLVIGGNDEALAVMEALRARGLWVPAIRPPTVPEGTARLRIALSAAHTEADIARLVAALAELAPAHAPSKAFA
ncbi:MAG: aminotransferase class I/II-fold pyridoxal phosphate-dependent enzyme, partial [Comamonadaceae bacterium]